MALVTWRDLITKEMSLNDDSWDNVVAATFEVGETDWPKELRDPHDCLDKPFNARAVGVEEGCPFTLWTEQRVYFPLTYDGYESVGSVFRHPNRMPPTTHIGNG